MVATNSYIIDCDAGSGPVTVTLGVGTTRAFTRQLVRKSDASANAITVTVQTGEKLNGVTNGTYTVNSQYETAEFISIGTDGWIIV